MIANIRQVRVISTHSHPKVAAIHPLPVFAWQYISTHSHPKVAAVKKPKSYLTTVFQHTATRRWLLKFISINVVKTVFQHTATRRWLLDTKIDHDYRNAVSTHSHPKVAAFSPNSLYRKLKVSTHSHPKVAAHDADDLAEMGRVSTHSHPKVAASQYGLLGLHQSVSTHSHPKVAACLY